MSELVAGVPATLLAGAAVTLATLLLLRPRPALSARPPPPGLLLVPVAGLGLVLPPGLVVAALVVVLGGRRWWRQRRVAQTAAVTAGCVLEACELMAAEVSAGQPPGRALGHAAGAWAPLTEAARTADLGGDVAGVLRRLAHHPGASELRLVAAAWEVSHRSGGGLAAALARVAGALRAGRATRLVVEGELASARATARLVAALPVLVLFLGGAGAGAQAWGFLLTTPGGWACLVAGLGLVLAGLTWIERIAAGALR